MTNTQVPAPSADTPLGRVLHNDAMRLLCEQKEAEALLAEAVARFEALGALRSALAAGNVKAHDSGVHPELRTLAYQNATHDAWREFDERKIEAMVEKDTQVAQARARFDAQYRKA